MLPSRHAIYGFLFSLIIFIIFPGAGLIGALAIFFGAFFTDFDHYLVFVYRKKNISLKKALDYFYKQSEEEVKSKKAKSPLMIFHTIESLIVVALLSYYYALFIYVFIGMVFHILLDILYMTQHKLLYTRDHSIIHYYLTKKS